MIQTFSCYDPNVHIITLSFVSCAKHTTGIIYHPLTSEGDTCGRFHCHMPRAPASSSTISHANDFPVSPTSYATEALSPS